MKSSGARFVSRLTNNTMALVLAGGRGQRLDVLTDWRTKPAVPFGGKFRIIDFALSNCMHSGINKICVLTQYKSHSLIRHLIKGWTKINNDSGDFLDIVPAQQWTDNETWFQGTADAVFQSLDIIESHGPEYIIILAGDHIYNMDYGEMLAEHVNNGADFSIACIAIEAAKAAHQFGVMSVNDSGRIINFEEKPKNPKAISDEDNMVLVSMGIYVVSQKYLASILRDDAVSERSNHDFGKDIIPEGLRRGGHFHAYEFRSPTNDEPPYWRDVGTVDSYYAANMELLEAEPPLNLYDKGWPVATYQRQLAPAFIKPGKDGSIIQSSIISSACLIENSEIRRSIIFSEVRVEAGCKLNGVLALGGCRVGANCHLQNVILDNGCIVPAGTVVGFDAQADGKKFNVTKEGIVLINRQMLGQGISYNPEF